MNPPNRQHSPEVPTGRARTRPREEAAIADDLLARYSLSRPGDKRVLPIAFCAAVILHAMCAFINFPATTPAQKQPNASQTIVVRRYIPPPPPPQRPRTSCTKKDTKRKIPIPDPTPDYPEPVTEPEPDLPIAPTAFDGDLLIGEPEPPSGAGFGAAGATGRGPVLAGVGDVTNPVRIDECCPRPEYPELARAARVCGEVILQAVILCDGSVTEAEVLRCTTPGFGFEESAVHAVEQWRYLPATQDGTPVAVYFTIIVDFNLV
jgi:protein TonB